MTREEALKTLMKMRAWREWGKEQREEERPEMPEQKEVDEAFDVCIKLLQSSLPSNLDQTAEECSVCEYLEEVLAENDIEVLRERLKNTFKTGAEWMAGQGVKAHCIESANPVSESSDARLHLITLLYEENKCTHYVRGGDDIDIIILKK